MKQKYDTPHPSSWYAKHQLCLTFNLFSSRFPGEIICFFSITKAYLSFRLVDSKDFNDSILCSPNSVSRISPSFNLFRRVYSPSWLWKYESNKIGMCKCYYWHWSVLYIRIYFIGCNQHLVQTILNTFLC